MTGRPRSEAVRCNVLRAAIELLGERGFKAMTIESIAERAGASKVTLYRWWPNKAAIVMDAFFAEMSPKLSFHETESALHDLREQMLSVVDVLAGRCGALLAGLSAEGVLDGEVGDAFRQRWILPRRVEARRVVQRGIDDGELREDLDVDVALDALYGPMYYRLLIQHAPLSRAFVEALWANVTAGIAAPRRDTARRLAAKPARLVRDTPASPGATRRARG